MKTNENATLMDRENEALAPGQHEDDDLHAEIIANLKRARKHRTDWREEKKENDDFEAGRQWSEEDLQKLEREGRPAVVFNLTCKTYNTVSGTELQNPRETTYFPQEISDGAAADSMNQ